MDARGYLTTKAISVQTTCSPTNIVVSFASCNGPKNNNTKFINVKLFVTT